MVKTISSGHSSNNPFDHDGDSSSDERLTSNNPLDDASGDKCNSTPAEASWQYLGNLPYRRIPIYSQVQWHANSNSLASFPASALQQRHAHSDVPLATKTVVKACPRGGPARCSHVARGGRRV